MTHIVWLVGIVLVSAIRQNVATEERTTDDDVWTNSTEISTPKVPPSLALYLDYILRDSPQYMAYKVAIGIYTFYLPAIVIAGLVGNILSAIVMLQKQNRRIFCFVYMTFLALADSFALLTLFSLYFTEFAVPSRDSLASCKVRILAAVWFPFISTYLLLASTFDRVIAISRPLRAKGWCTPKKANITALVIAIATAFFKMPYYWLVVVVDFEDQTTCHMLFHANPGLAWTFYYWVNTVISAHIPFLSLLTMNCIIIRQIRNRGKYFAKMEKVASEKVRDPMSKSGKRN